MKKHENSSFRNKKISVFLIVFLIITNTVFFYLFWQNRPGVYVTTAGTEFISPVSSESVRRAAQSRHGHLGEIKVLTLLTEPTFLVAIINDENELRAVSYYSAYTGEELHMLHILPHGPWTGTNNVSEKVIDFCQPN